MSQTEKGSGPPSGCARVAKRGRATAWSGRDVDATCVSIVSIATQRNVQCNDITTNSNLLRERNFCVDVNFVLTCDASRR